MSQFKRIIGKTYMLRFENKIVYIRNKKVAQTILALEPQEFLVRTINFNTNDKTNN